MRHDHYLLAVLTQIGIYAPMTASLNIQYGFTGLVNFGLLPRRIRHDHLGRARLFTSSGYRLRSSFVWSPLF